MRKPCPVNVEDAAAVTRWQGETRELLKGLHATGIDAAAKHRVHSRKELRKRVSRLTRKLNAMLDAVQSPGQELLDNAAGNGAPEGPASEGGDLEGPASEGG